MDEAEKIKKNILELVDRYHEIQFSEKPFFPGVTPVTHAGKLFGSEELKNGVEAVLDGWWTEGRYTAEFEKRFCEYTGRKHTLLTNSGSSANLIAFSALTSKELGDRRVAPGDEVITIASSFPTTINPIVQCGAVPVFVDIEPLETGQYNIDCSRLEDAISSKTKAIMMAHTISNPFNLEKILELKEKHNLWLIEDCCDAMGSKYKGEMVGTHGDFATYSFFPAHHITMGEGGAVTINSGKLRRLALKFRNWGRDCWCPPGVDNTCNKRFGWKIEGLPDGYDHKNIYTELGFNLKNTDLHASIGLAQLGRVEEFHNKRQENFDYLDERLKPYQNQIILPSHLPESDPSWYGYMISVRKDVNFSRDEMVRYLNEKMVMSRPLFCGNITKHPSFDGVNYRTIGNLENTNETMTRTFFVGVQPNLSNEKMKYMANTITSFLDAKTKS